MTMFHGGICPPLTVLMSCTPRASGVFFGSIYINQRTHEVAPVPGKGENADRGQYRIRQREMILA